MSRHRNQPNARLTRRPDAEKGAEIDEPAKTERPLAMDDDLHEAFFADGLSDDVITAASEREQDREALRRAVHGRSNRWIYGVAGAAACGILALGLVPRDKAAPPAPAEPPPAQVANITREPAPAAPAAAAPENANPVGDEAVVAPTAQEPAADPAAAAMAAAAAPPAPTSEAPGAPAATPPAAPPATHALAANQLRAGAAPVPETAPVAEAAPTAAPKTEPRAAALGASQPVAARSAPRLPRSTSSSEQSSAALKSAASDVLAEPAPGSPPDPRATCQQLLRRGKFSDINAICGRAFAAAPDASLAVQIARNALERERYTDAQVWATKAIEVDGQLGEAFLTLGGAEQGLGHPALARTAYKRYLELEPDGPFAEDVRALINQL